LKLLAQQAGREALQAVDDLGAPAGRVGRDEQLNVVGHDLQGVNRHRQFRRLAGEQAAQTEGDFIDQHRPAILGAPNDVVLQREERTGIFGITSVHAVYYTSAGQLIKDSRRTVRILGGCGHSPAS
jgi:hypothetical protein